MCRDAGDPDTRTMVPVEQVELEFPGRGPGGQPGRAVASRLDLGPTSPQVDVAVLDLGEDYPGWLPAPVPVWPAGRSPGRVQVFGYPLAERTLNGVWRQFTVAGPAPSGTVQLDWIGDAGTFPGHSGGPVIDADSHTLAGILVEGSDRGLFDRFLPVTLIARAWPRLPRPWLMTGHDPGEARSHFTSRSRGQRSIARGGDLFRGRHVALDRIRGWLDADEPPGEALVITGQPGAGKSAVLARAALSLEAEHGGPGLAFHARDATIGDFLTALADLTGMEAPTSTRELIITLGDLPDQPPTRVVLDALDEAASDLDRRRITGVLAEIAVLPGLRVAAATRPLTAGDPYARDGLLAVFSVITRDDRNLVDLDSDTYFDLDGLRQFAAALLARDGMDQPGPDGVWKQYRTHPAVRNRLAAVIAERARRNFLVAAMAADRLSNARIMIDPAARGFDPADIESGVGEALSKYLEQLLEERRERVRALLTALAYARGAGLDDPNWLAFAQALGYSATVLDLDILRRSRVADYLLQTTTTERGARPVTRLFHQALTDELLAQRNQRLSDERALLDVLLGQAKRTGWQARYLREHVAEHAAAASRLDKLLEDPHYLLSVDPARLVPHLKSARSAPARATAAVYRQTAHHLANLDRPVRASQLELMGRRLGHRNLADRIASAAPDRPWQTRWSHGRRTTDHQVLTGHSGPVAAVAAGALPDGTPVVVSGSYDGTVRVWRLADGALVLKPLTGHNSAVAAVAAGALPDGTPVVVSGGHDGTVRVWRLADGSPVGEPLTGHSGPVEAVAAGRLPDGTPVVVSGGGYADGTVRVWRLADGAPVGEPLTGHASAVEAVAAGALPDGTPVVVSGSGHDGTVRVWRLADGIPVGEPLTGGSGGEASVAVGALPDGTPVIVSGGGLDLLNVITARGWPVRVWRLADGAPVLEPLTGHTGRVNAVAAGALPDGTPVIVSGSHDGTVRVWRLADGAPVLEPLTGHTGRVKAVAAAGLPDGTPVIVSGSQDGTVRVWRLADGAPVLEPLTGHAGTVSAVAAGALPDGTPVIVSGGHDGTVRVWRLADGAPVLELLTGHAGPVSAVAAGALPDGTPVIVSGGHDGTVRVWRLADGSPVGEPLTGHTGPVEAVAAGALPDGTPVIVSGGGYADGTVRVWRLADGDPLKPPLDLYEWVRAVAVHGNVIVTAAEADIAAHQLALL